MRSSRYVEEDLRYMQSLASAVVQRSPRYMMMVLSLIALSVIATIVWMGFAEIDVVVRGSGKVIPSQKLQIIQSLEGGVVSEILVREGDLVEVSQPLIKISDVAFASSFGENQLHQLELKAKIARLKAEADGSAYEADQTVLREAPDLMRSAEELYRSRVLELEQTVQILREQVRQQESGREDAQARKKSFSGRLALVREELALKEPLVVRGLVTRVEFLQLKKQENEILSEFDSARLLIPRINSTIEETRRKIEQGTLEFRNAAKRELNEALSESSRIQETQQALKDRVQRTTIRSPVKGTVSRLHTNTVGGVVPAGGPILEVVPFEDALLIEININPADIANIAAGQPARLKFSAYDFAIYGSIEGVVQFLSADTVTNEEGISYYIARIKPQRVYFGPLKRPLPVRVGMTVEADVITDKKTVLEYLLKPINRGLQRALSEA
ncbi:MAG: adhesin transport system membrane fusion protein [Gammaproteobacteria bacterium]